MSSNHQLKTNMIIKDMLEISTTQWSSFLKSLFNVLRNEGLNITGKNALNEINNLLMLVFIEGKYNLFNEKVSNERLKLNECDKFKNIFQDVQKKLDEYKKSVVSLKNEENDIYANLWDILYNEEYHLKTAIKGNKKEQEINSDLMPSLFFRFSRHPYLKKVISSPADSSKEIPSMSDITAFTHSQNKVLYGRNIYSMMKLIYEKFYKTDKKGKKLFNITSLSLDFDHLGEAWEKELEATGDTDKSKNGEFFTRRDLCNDVVKEVNPQYNEKIIDPACGSGGMLIGVISNVKEKLKSQYGNDTKKIEEEYLKYVKNNIYGVELRAEGFKNLCLNLVIHDTSGEILNNMVLGSSLNFKKNKHYNNSVDCIVANHPYAKGNKDAPIYAINTKNSEVIELEEQLLESDTGKKSKKPSIKNAFANLGEDFRLYWDCILNKDYKLPAENTPKFMMYYYNALKNGGRAGIVSDRGFLNNGTISSDSMLKRLREFLLTNCNLYKIWLLPKGIFTHTSFDTCVCFFEKGKPTQEIEFVDLYFKEEDKLKEKGKKPYHFKPGFKVSIDKIKKNNWSLDIKDYVEKEKGIEGETFNIPVEWKKLGEVCEIKKGKNVSKDTKEEKDDKNIYPVIGGGIDSKGYYYEYNVEPNLTLISEGGSCAGRVHRKNKKIYVNSHCYYLTPKEISNNLIFYLTKFLENKLKEDKKGGGIPNLSSEKVKNLLIPIPTNQQDQDNIVKFCDFLFEEGEKPAFIPDCPKKYYDLENFVKNYDGNYLMKLLLNEEYETFMANLEVVQCIKNIETVGEDRILQKEWDFITKDVEMEEVKLGDICEVKTSTLTMKDKDENGKYDLYSSSIVEKYKCSFKQYKNGIVMNKTNGQGKCKVWICNNFSITDAALALISEKYKYIFYKLKSIEKKITTETNIYLGAGRKNISVTNLKNFLIHIPKKTQDEQKIVQYLEEKMELHKQYWEHLKTIC